MAILKNTSVSDTGSIRLPSGTTAQRPSAAAGQMRFNSTTGKVEQYNASASAWFGAPAGVIATGGNSVYDVDTEGTTYRVHVFTSTGNSTLTVTKGGEVEYLIVAGGGGAGGGSSTSSYTGGGGGGAGGLLTGFTTVTPQAYTVTVGAGGGGGAYNVTNNSGSNGNLSSFAGISAAGGGGGGAGGNTTNSNRIGKAGGSGGGSGYRSTVGGAGNTPSTIPAQGNAGGFANTGEEGSGGGGGAGGVGRNGSNSPQYTGGAGGLGISLSITGTSVFYAGGGGAGGLDLGILPSGFGARGGAGGGGDGGFLSTSPTVYTGQNGTANTGGGGGGGTRHTVSNTGGSGGSGIVIIRYPLRQENPLTETGKAASDKLVLDLDFAKSTVYSGLGTVVNDSRLAPYVITASSAPTLIDRYTHRAHLNLNNVQITTPFLSSAIAGSNYTSPHALEIWVKITAFPQPSGSTARAGFIFGASSYGGIGIPWSGNSSGTLCRVYGFIRNDQAYRSAGNFDLSLNTWTHLMHVNEGTGSFRFYVNGTLNGSNTTPTGAASQDASAGNIGIAKPDIDGGGSLSYIRLPCQVGLARIYTSSLTATDVSNIFNATRWRFGV